MATNESQTGEELKDLEVQDVERTKRELVKEAKVASKLMSLYEEARSYKDEISRNWDSYIRFFRGDQWPKRRPSYKVSAVLNFMLENIERKTSLLTDTKPIPKVVVRADKMQDTADILNGLIEIIFEGQYFDQAQTDIIDDAQVFGSGFIYSPYDRFEKDVCVSSLDPRRSYFDPVLQKSYLLAEGEYFIMEDIWALEKAQDLFPKRADLMRADEPLSTFKPIKKGGIVSSLASFANRVVRTRGENEVKASQIPRVYVREFYTKNRSKDDSGNYRFKNMCRKSIMVGNVLVSDTENPYNDGEFPVDMLIWHKDFETAWGWGDVELLRSPQELLNKIIALQIENVMLMTNSIWIGDKDALSKEEWKRLTNSPGKTVRLNPGRQLRREPGTPLSPDAYNMPQYLEQGSEKITGMVDVIREIRTGQVSSGVGIESLQMMAQALIRLRSRTLESLHVRLGRKLISRIFQYYEPERIFDLLRSSKKQIAEKLDLETELIKPVSKRKDLDWTKIAFSIEPGSSLNLVKQNRRMESMRLREMQVIDDEALLDDLEYPHRDKVLERVEKKRQDMRNQEIQAQRGDQATRFPQQQGASPAGRQ